MIKYTPTAEQAAIIHAAMTSSEGLLIEALAGAAKTTTLKMVAHAIPPVMTLCLAFNKKIAEDMKKAMPSHVECSTLNSLGHRAWGKALGRRLTLNKDKIHFILGELITNIPSRADRGEAYAEMNSIKKAVSRAKLTGFIPERTIKSGGIKSTYTSDANFFEELSDELFEPLSPEAENLVIETLNRSISQAMEGKIDFDDQVYMPTLFGASFTRYPLVLVDEVQDLSMLNHLMLQRVAGSPARLIAVGDRWQSIYGFRGACPDSMDRLQRTFNLRTMQLSTSFRCPRAVVQLAQTRAPNMRAPEWAEEGSITHHETWDHQTIAEGSFILCRNNAPLFSAALYLLKNKRAVAVQGRDIGPGLIKLLKKLAGSDESLSTKAVHAAINTWLDQSLTKAKPSQEEALHDRADCLRVFADAGKNLGEAIAYAEHTFAAEGSIQLMSIHKAKGLEADTVYHLDSWRIPSKYTDPDDAKAMAQELNLQYVATTRTKKELHFIDTTTRKDKAS